MAELYGKGTGIVKGKGGSMHLFDADKHFLGGHGIVGGQIPLATGVAFATKYRGTDQATLVFFGEAAVNQGAFHESLNMAALWKLPCVFIIENNRYGMGTALERASSIHDIYERASSYNMARAMADGQDVFAVRAAVQEAIQRARTEQLPTLLEMRTYRFMGHSMSDPGHYRTRAEIEKYQERDPIKVFGQNLREKGVLDDAGTLVRSGLAIEQRAGFIESMETLREPRTDIESARGIEQRLRSLGGNALGPVVVRVGVTSMPRRCAGCSRWCGA